MNAASPPEVTNALRTTRSTSDRHAIMSRSFHSREKLFNSGVNDWASFIRASEFLYSLHGIESQQGNKFHFVAVLANKQFRAVVSGDFSGGDARENFAAQHVLIHVCICWFGPAAPDSRNHLVSMMVGRLPGA